MTKVRCAEINCAYCIGNVCRAKEVNFTAGNIHTKNQGYIQHWECRTYQMSKEAEELFKMLKKYDNKPKESEVEENMLPEICSCGYRFENDETICPNCGKKVEEDG